MSLTSASFFDRFKKHQFGTREFKRGQGQVSFWSSAPGHLSDSQISQFLTNPASLHNIVHTANDPVDLTGGSASVGSANGYFPRPAKSSQGFKTFGIKLGKFGHLYGTGAFYSHRDYPYEIRR